jgi:hypothetical protein
MIHMMQPLEINEYPNSEDDFATFNAMLMVA